MRLALAICVFTALPVASQEPSLDAGEMRAQQEASRQQIWENGAAVRERRERTEARLKEACDRLFRSRPDETVTNPLCYEVFLNHGLPD